MRTLPATASRFALITGACAVGLGATGALFAAATGGETQVSVASALFIGGAVLIGANALGETFRERGFDLRSGMSYPGAGSSPRGSFGWTLVGIVLIGFGVLILVV